MLLKNGCLTDCFTFEGPLIEQCLMMLESFDDQVVPSELSFHRHILLVINFMPSPGIIIATFATN